MPPLRFFTLGNESHTFYELCLSSVRGMGMCMSLAVPVSSGKFCGTCVSTAPAVEPAAMSFTVTLTRSTIDATAAVVFTCSASADCTDSATPMCSAGACVAMSCDGGSFTPDGAVHGVLSCVFRAVYTGTRPGVSPAIRAGKGWRGRRELAPRCSATPLGACIGGYG